MKKIFNIILSGIVVLSASSCKKYLDINTNPNQAITSTPELVLPQALVSTAALLTNGTNYNFYGSSLVGYAANAGGVGGFGSFISYQYSTSDYQELFQRTYDNLADYQYIIDQTAGKTDQYALFNAAAQAMRAYDYQLLVDTYNDVPYSEALKGTAQLLAKYDKGADIYKDLGDRLDAALEVFKTEIAAQASEGRTTPNLFHTADPLFGRTGIAQNQEAILWAKFINTLKLKLIIRGGTKVTFTKTTLDPIGFLTDDAMVNPGYARIIDKQNPFWDWFAYDGANTIRTRGGQYIPTPFIMSYYNGTKLSDPGRGYALYNLFNGSTAPTNQLGNLIGASAGGTPSSWYVANAATGTATNYYGVGIFKGPTAAQPLLLASESYFLVAEANLLGKVSGTAQTNFLSGIRASYNYLYQPESNSGTAVDFDPAGDYAAYIDDNSGSTLVNFTGTNEQKLEAIITQKYIALNFLFGHEAWNEFRRTGYPSITGTTATTTFASLGSASTAANKLPTRILYPGSEFTYNSGNVPKDINPYTSKIFWAK
jgi:hypothetical protein